MAVSLRSPVATGRDERGKDETGKDETGKDEAVHVLAQSMMMRLHRNPTAMQALLEKAEDVVLVDMGPPRSEGEATIRMLHQQSAVEKAASESRSPISREISTGEISKKHSRQRLVRFCVAIWIRMASP